MPAIRTTDVFDHWFDRLRDLRTRVRIQARIDRLATGNPGDHKSVGGGVNELRIDLGPGYRVYYTQSGAVLVILLCGVISLRSRLTLTGPKPLQQTSIRNES